MPLKWLGLVAQLGGQHVVLAALGPTNYGHAVGDVTPDDPPVHFIYDSPLATLALAVSSC